MEDRAYYLSRHGDICVSDLKGNNFHRLTFDGQVSNPVWSPDSESLAWLYGQGNPLQDWKSIKIWNQRTLKVVDLSLSMVVNQNFGEIAWSGDEKKIYLRGQYGGMINVLNGRVYRPPSTAYTRRGFSIFAICRWKSNHL